MDLTREQAKDLFKEIMKQGGVDFDDFVRDHVKQAMQAEIEAAERRNDTPDMATVMQQIMRGYKPAEEQKKRPKGQIVGRIIRALASGKGDKDAAIFHAKKNWGEDDPVIKALSAGDATAGGFLLTPEFSEELIELLRPLTAVRRLGPTVMPMDSGSLSIPKLITGSTAAYVGENQRITASEQQTGMLEMVWKKLAVLTPISNDLLLFSGGRADAVVRDDIVTGLAQREDLAFLQDDGTLGTPKGLLNWAPAANVISATAGQALADVTTDLGRLMLQLMNGDVRMLRPAWIMAPRTMVFLMTVRDGNGNFAFREEMLAGNLWGFPYAATTQVPVNLGGGSDESRMTFADMADAVIAESSQVIVDASAQAAYFDGSNVVAAYSRDQTVVRAIARHDFGMRHDASVAILDTITWAP